MSTPVEVWAPAFAKVLTKTLTPEVVFVDSEDWRVPLRRWCRLCETHVPIGQIAAHVAEHERERQKFDGGKKGKEDRAPGGVGETPSGGRPTGQTTTERKQMASTDEKAPAAEATEAPTGEDIFQGLLARIKGEKIGTEVKLHPKGTYARVFVNDKKHAGYIVRGKTKVNVYPQALAADMPKDLGFKKVKLGSHHYGRGEVIVPVDGEGDFDAAVTALQAAAKRVAAETPKAEASKGNGKVQAKSDPKKKTSRKRKKEAATA